MEKEINTRGNLTCTEQDKKERHKVLEEEKLVILKYPSTIPNWQSDRQWCLRLMVLVYKEVKLQTLFAWCNTLGGAHSSLGETVLKHAEEAGVMSQRQYMLSYERGDPLLMSRCRLYQAFSCLQQGHFKKAKRIIKEEYLYLTHQTTTDKKLLNMCASAWNKYKQLTTSTSDKR